MDEFLALISSAADHIDEVRALETHAEDIERGERCVRKGEFALDILYDGRRSGGCERKDGNVGDQLADLRYFQV